MRKDDEEAEQEEPDGALLRRYLGHVHQLIRTFGGSHGDHGGHGHHGRARRARRR